MQKPEWISAPAFAACQPQGLRFLFRIRRCFVKTNPVEVQRFRDAHRRANRKTVISQLNASVIATGNMGFLCSNLLRQTLTFSKFD